MAVPCAAPRCRRSTVPCHCPSGPRQVSIPQGTLYKRSPAFGTAVLQDKVHLGKCKPSPAAVSGQGSRAVCPVVPSQPLAALAVLHLCHAVAIPGAPGAPRAGKSKDGHGQLGAGARRHHGSLLERPRAQRGLGVPPPLSQHAGQGAGGGQWWEPRGPAPSPAQGSSRMNLPGAGWSLTGLAGSDC